MDPKWLTIRPGTIHTTPAEHGPTEQSAHTEEAFFISVKLREKGRIKPQICEKETEWYPLCRQIPPNNPGALNTRRSICAFQEPRVIIDSLHTHHKVHKDCHLFGVLDFSSAWILAYWYSLYNKVSSSSGFHCREELRQWAHFQCFNVQRFTF